MYNESAISKFHYSSALCKFVSVFCKASPTALHLTWKCLITVTCDQRIVKIQYTFVGLFCLLSIYLNCRY